MPVTEDRVEQLEIDQFFTNPRVVYPEPTATDYHKAVLQQA